MAPRFLTILTGRNLPKIRQPREPEPSIINEKTIADFTRVVEQTGGAIKRPGKISPLRSWRAHAAGLDTAAAGRRWLIVAVSRQIWGLPNAAIPKGNHRSLDGRPAACIQQMFRSTPLR
jgi:hypothetical protein